MSKKIVQAPSLKDASGVYLPPTPPTSRLAKIVNMGNSFSAQAAFTDDRSKYIVAQCSRRAGKCRPKGTLVKTPLGSRPIEDLRPGDDVYGYDYEGSVSLTKVRALYDKGQQEVVDLIWNGRVLASSTIEHRWLAHNTFKNRRKVKSLKDFNSRDKISTEYTPIPGGSKRVKEAYSLGAFLGDGCSRDGGLHISGADVAIFDLIATELGCTWKKIHINNYTVSFYGVDKHSIEHYDKWCHNLYAHEKTCDINEIRTWTRESQLRFLAGLIDTDGSVNVQDGRLNIRIGMQAKVVISAVKDLLLDLFQIQARHGIDRRPRYKNGPVYTLSVSTNLDAKRLLKELPLQCARKKWKAEYSDLNERNTNKKYVGFKLGPSRLEHCYDIEVGNDTNLYLDANGMVGHNTNGLAIRFFKTLETHPKSQCVYLSLTLDSARDIMWPVLHELNDKYELGCEFKESTLTMTYPNGSLLKLYGADMKNFIKRLKGRKYPGVAIDEAQDFGTHLQSLVDDVLTPSISDYADGWLAVTGTPGPVPQGYFFQITQERKFGYSFHAWTLLDNPYMPDPAGFIQDLKAKREWTDEHPTLKREYLNHWILDPQSLWVRYKAEVNHFDGLTPGVKYNYIMGIDLGFKDADAIAILAYDNHSPTTYLVEELITAKQGLTELVDQVKKLQTKYDVSKMVIDEGGLGKKIAEEMRRRHQIPVQPADKARKQENIELLNDSLRLGRFKAKADSRFVQDSYLIQIDWDKSRPDKIVIKKDPHSDIIDAVLYAYRESPAYSYTPEEKKLIPGTKEWADAQPEKLWQEAREHFETQAQLEREMNEYSGYDPNE